MPALAEGLHCKEAGPAELLSSTGPRTLDLLDIVKGEEYAHPFVSLVSTGFRLGGGPLHHR